MKQLRYTSRLLVAFIKRFKGILLLSVIGGIVLFVGLFQYIPKIMAPKERIGLTGLYHTEDLPDYILDQIGEGLTKLDETGTAIPALARTWETPDEGKTWIFKLQENKKWHDGTPVTSETFEYDFVDVSVETPDPLTIVFKLDDPFAPFPTLVSKPLFKKERGLLGTDEWRVVDLTIDETFVSSIKIKNNSNHTKEYKIYPTENRTKLAFKLGEVDILRDVYDPIPLNSWSTASVEEISNADKVVTLFFNTNDAFLSDKDVRQGLVYALNKTEFGGERAISPINPNSWAYNSQVKKYTYDEARARELLDGIPDELLSKPITIISAPLLLPIAEQISEQWNTIGLTTIVQVSSIVPQEFQVYLTILDVPDDPDQYTLWHDSQTSNISQYKNDRINKLLEDGRLEMDKEERKRIYLDFQRFLLEDVPAIFLYHPVTYTIRRN